MRDWRHLHADAENNQSKKQPTQCTVSGCLRATKNGKPFCTDHIILHPYVAALSQRLEAQAAELKKLQTVSRLVGDSTFQTDIISYLKKVGSRTVKRVARDLCIEQDVLLKILKNMKTKKFTRFSTSKRGDLVVELRRLV